MILGVGIDIVKVARIEGWLKNDGAALRRYFDKDEASEIEKSVCPKESLAAHYAAKEAFGKALGCGLKNIKLQNIVVKKNECGKPTLVLKNELSDFATSMGVKNIFLSLTHEKEYGVACVVIEG